MTDLSVEALNTLRSIDTFFTGTDFVRCRCKDISQAMRVAKEIGEEGVHWSWHEQLGDYLKVARNTRAFSVICQLKS
jgi:hypothetical protein